jgi:predicted Zn-dependent protease
MTEAQEIQMGREADPEIVASMGVYEDAAWASYVDGLGKRMALTSERPNLPWTFRIIDDPTVNAFAVPGGFIYVTRGILTHFGSEAELMGVLGHEIGHVTARHSVSQISTQQAAQVGLVVGSIASSTIARFADAIGTGLGLLFLSYGRDDERQADDLGLRYMTREGYNPREMAATFEMLAGASAAQDGARIPGFLSSHPDPLERRDRILQKVASGEFSGSRIERDSYLARLEGMTFGENPREGFFRQGVFYHPEMAFRLDFPQGWHTLNQKTAVQGISQEEDAILVLTLAEGSSPRAARDAFLGQEGIAAGNPSEQAVNGLPASRADFQASTEDGVLQGTVLFVQHGGRVFRILGYSTQQRWGAVANTVRAAVTSFRPVTDRAILDVQPARMTLVRTSASMTLEPFNARYPSTCPLATLSTINQFSPGETIPSGTLLKRVIGGTTTP